jgi:3-oxoacyl-[acyl-carrier protein] reductase
MDGQWTGDSQVAVVTGAARGIGRACAQRLAATGRAVAVVDILADQAEATAAELRATGARAMAVASDVRQLDAAAEAAARIHDEFGRIDVLVNNAGRTMSKGLLEITEAEWQDTLDVNLKSCFAWSRAVAPYLLAAGSGRIVNVASLNALTGGVTSAVSKFAYAASKAGVLGLTRSLAKELAPAVAVNAVCPGIVKTELTEALLSAREAELSAGISLGRIGRPDDIAAVVTFFATVEPNFTTGQYLTVDGGQWVA